MRPFVVQGQAEEIEADDRTKLAGEAPKEGVAIVIAPQGLGNANQGLVTGKGRGGKFMHRRGNSLQEHAYGLSHQLGIASSPQSGPGDDSFPDASAALLVSTFVVTTNERRGV